MKKKIAVFANGWNSENLGRFINGMKDCFEPCSADIFLFLSFASYGFDFETRRSESTVYDIPDLTTFDGAVIFGPGLNFPEVIDHIFKLVEDAGIPAISIGIKRPGFFYVGMDNYVGMKALCDHLLDVHKVKNVLFVGGPAENFDSSERERALRDAMKERNLPFSDDDIFYSDWETGKAVRYILDKYTKETLPEAIVCANDLLALEISLHLEEIEGCDYEKIKITGFDYLEDGRLFYPSIATVDQRYDLMGRAAAEHFIKKINGEETEQEVITSCEFIPGESCGCTDCRNDDELRHRLVRILPAQRRKTDSSDGRIAVLERTIIYAKDFGEMKTLMRELSYSSEGDEGGTFYIMMDPGVAHLADDGFSFPEYAYGDTMCTVAGKKNGVPVKTEVIKRSELLPDYCSEGPNMIYGFCTIAYNKTFSCGYMVIGMDSVTPKDLLYYKYKARMMRALDSYKMNLELVKLNNKLASLMEQDTLTKVKNRTAFDKYVKMIDSNIADKSSPAFAVVFLDINDLKTINDEYGHEKGDEYIKNCCSYICETFKRSPVFRIGGDEFVVVAIGDDYLHYRLLVASMKEAMQKKAKESDVEKRISIASGYAEYKPGSAETFADILKRADDMMYQVKAEMKKGRVR